MLYTCYKAVLCFLLLNGFKMSNRCQGSYAGNHSFVFISGWPQSGTSLVYNMLTYSPWTSTMILKCNQLVGKKCLNWNHEGQWLLRSSETRNAIKSGQICPVDHIPSTLQGNLRSEVSLTSLCMCMYLPRDVVSCSNDVHSHNSGVGSGH